MREFLNDHQQGHSAFQMSHFITGKSGCNVFGWYKQTLWELVSRWQTLRSAYVEIEILEAEIEELEACPSSRKNALEIKKRRIGIEHSLLSLRDTEREFAHFYQQAARLKAEYSRLTPEQIAEQEREHWIYHARTLAALDILSVGRPSKSTWGLIAALPPELRQQVNLQADPTWVLEQSSPPLGTAPALPHAEIRRFIQNSSTD